MAKGAYDGHRETSTIPCDRRDVAVAVHELDQVAKVVVGELIVYSPGEGI